MSPLDVFQYGDREVRTLTIAGEPWFVASDVAQILGYREAYDLTRRLDDDEKGPRSVRTPGGEQIVTIISEPGLYTAILGSKVHLAKNFKRWVTHDVLPTIRKTGRYGSDADMLAHLPSSQMLQLAAEAAKRAEDAEAQIERDKPKVLFADSVAASDDAILVAQLCTVLKQNGVDIGQNRLFDRLRAEGYLGRGAHWNRPTQKAMDRGLFRVIERTVQGSDGRPIVKFTPKVTGKGQQYFVERYAKRAVAA